MQSPHMLLFGHVAFDPSLRDWDGDQDFFTNTYRWSVVVMGWVYAPLYLSLACSKILDDGLQFLSRHLESKSCLALDTVSLSYWQRRIGTWQRTPGRWQEPLPLQSQLFLSRISSIIIWMYFNVMGRLWCHTFRRGTGIALPGLWQPLWSRVK